jgi:hypothetical protein
MSAREVLAVAGIAAALGGSLEASHEFDVDATAQALYVTAKTCALTYDVRSGEDKGPSLEPGIPGLVDGGTNGTSSQLVAFSSRGPDSYRIVTRKTLDCLRAGAWIPGGAAVDTDEMRAGQPERLLAGYASLQKSRGENFNASSTLAGILVGSVLGGFGAAYRRRRQASQTTAAEDDPAL